MTGLITLISAACDSHAATRTVTPSLDGTTSAIASTSPSSDVSLPSSPSSEGSPSPSSQASPSLSPDASATPVVFPSCPALIRNVSGSYSFRCTASWKYVNCETSHSAPYTWLLNPEGCLVEQYSMRMMVWSLQGDHSADPENGVGTSVGQRQSSQPVIVAGVTGTRRTYLVTSANGFSPQGTVQVLYTFVTGGRTYFPQYNRFPSDQDLTTQFDQMITTSLRFSA